MGSYTDMFALQMCIITLRFLCMDPNYIGDGSLYMYTCHISTGFEIYTRHSLPCPPLVSTLPSFNHQGYTDGGVDLQPAKECLQKTLGENFSLQMLATMFTSFVFLILDTNPFTRKCQNISKYHER